MKKTPILLLLFFYVQTYAQSVDLRDRRAFFQQQSQVYQKWLEQNALDQVFVLYGAPEVYEVGVILKLQFTMSDPAKLSDSWFTARENFKQENNLNLEEILFLKLLNLFDLRAHQVKLKIKNDYSGLITQYGVEMDYSQEEVRVKQSFPRGTFTDRRIPPPTVKTRDLQLPKLTKKEVYKKIQTFIKEEYQSEKNIKKRICLNDTPKISPLNPNTEKLIITVSGLCEEVVKSPQKLFFCETFKRLQLNCSPVNQEKLIFIFKFDESNNKITSQLEGQYRIDYIFFRGKEIDMDDASEDEYLSKFLDKLIPWLQKNN